MIICLIHAFFYPDARFVSVTRSSNDDSRALKHREPKFIDLLEKNVLHKMKMTWKDKNLATLTEDAK